MISFHKFEMESLNEAKERFIIYTSAWILPTTIVHMIIIALILKYLSTIIIMGGLYELILLPLSIVLLLLLSLNVVKSFIVFYCTFSYDIKLESCEGVDFNFLKNLIESHYGKCIIRRIFRDIWRINISFPGRSGEMMLIHYRTFSKSGIRKHILVFIKPYDLLTEDEIRSIIQIRKV